MLNKLYIDGIDAYAAFGIFITSGGYDGLLQYPPLKKIESNNWHEEDGIEPDLSKPAVDTKEFSIGFGVHRQMRTGEFFDLISNGSFHNFEFKTIERACSLRLVDQQNLSVVRNLQAFTLRFAFDFPLSEYVYLEPRSDYLLDSGYELDGRSLNEYGIAIREGSLAEVLKSPAVKKNLLVNTGNLNGAIYDGENVTFESKEVKLNCLMRASNFGEFWRNYDAFIYDLIRPGERMLYVDETGYEYPCYYKNCNVTEFYPTGKIWFKFDLTLIFTSFRLYGDDYLLATENDIPVTTEDGENYIDLDYEN